MSGEAVELLERSGEPLEQTRRLEATKAPRRGDGKYDLGLLLPPPSWLCVCREEDGQWKEDQKLEAHSDWVRDVAWAPSIGLPTSTIASCSQVRPLLWGQAGSQCPAPIPFPLVKKQQGQSCCSKSWQSFAVSG